MLTRLLPPEEWCKLVGTELETVWPHLDPVNARVMVVEDHDRIVGTWVAFPLVHVECIWIAPDHRGHGAVARRLLWMMRRVAQEMGASSVVTAALNPDVAGMLERLGAVKLPGDHYALGVQKES